MLFLKTYYILLQCPHNKRPFVTHSKEDWINTSGYINHRDVAQKHWIVNEVVLAKVSKRILPSCFHYTETFSIFNDTGSFSEMMVMSLCFYSSINTWQKDFKSAKGCARCVSVFPVYILAKEHHNKVNKKRHDHVCLQLWPLFWSITHLYKFEALTCMFATLTKLNKSVTNTHLSKYSWATQQTVISHYSRSLQEHLLPW